MTRNQRFAWLNLAFFGVLVVVMVLEYLDRLAGGLPVFLLGLAGTGVAVGIVLMGRKGVVEDERDRIYASRAMSMAHLALMFCLLIGVFVAGLVYPAGSVPLRFLYLLGAGSWAVSMLAQSVATLVQYRIG
jgi:hypothetical protein